MVELMSKWAEQIILAIIIVSIIENLLPNGNIKKYIKIILGFFVLLVLISPITKNFSIAKVNFNEILGDYKSGNINYNKIENNNSNNILDTYIDKFKESIRAKVESKNYVVKDINLTFVRDDEYSLKTMQIEIEKKESNKDNKIIINQVNILIDENNVNVKEIEENEINELKSYLKEIYNVKNENIIINGR